MPKTSFVMMLEGLTRDNWEQVEIAAKKAIATSFDVSVTNIETMKSVHVQIETESVSDTQVLDNTINGISHKAPCIVFTLLF